ncbi:uncharacterized protein LOC126988451 [Eriocheir sinensis]|uniref:uncharacterized protein LOC126988451 n=1 Tax=Eriocheir sinensis TaxID=95602 RepID=UPI0021CA0788|nr:uncharacterized protein LOC126988451 [Eriocheir sinensis]
MCVFPLCGGRGQTKDTIIVSLGQALSSAQPGSGSTTTVPPPPPPDLSSASTEPAPCRPAQRPTRSSEAATMRWSPPALLLLPLLLAWDTTSVSRVCGRKAGDHPIQQPNPASAPDLLSGTRNPWIRRDQIPQPTTAGPDYTDDPDAASSPEIGELVPHVSETVQPVKECLVHDGNKWRTDAICQRKINKATQTTPLR